MSRVACSMTIVNCEASGDQEASGRLRMSLALRSPFRHLLVGHPEQVDPSSSLHDGQFELLATPTPTQRRVFELLGHTGAAQALVARTIWRSKPNPLVKVRTPTLRRVTSD